MAGIFTIAQSFIQTSIFDFYFYLLPFGLSLAAVFIAAGLRRLSLSRPARPNMGRSFVPLGVFGALAMLASVALCVYGSSLRMSWFVLMLVVVQLAAYVSFWYAIVQGGRLASSLVGFAAGLMLGYLMVATLDLDPLIILSIAVAFTLALCVAHYFSKEAVKVVYVLVVGLAVFGVFHAKQFDLTPPSMGWMMDEGKAGATDTGKRTERRWGPAGLTEMYTLSSDERAAWLYTNSASPGLVLLDRLAAYDDAWWTQKAPLAMAIYDAVQPKNMVDIGSVPSDLAWRAAGRNTRNIYGVYGSRDWALMNAPGIDSMRQAVVPLREAVLPAGQNLKSPVDMIVLSSAHEGKEGWVSSNAGEQRYFDQENLLRCWQGLDEHGVLVLLARQQPVFFRQIFSIWTALKSTGMSDAEFLDHAWGVVPDTATADSPYRYALVLTRKARDEKFAQAIRRQVLQLPIKYLFGYSIPPSRPYDYFYRNDVDKVHTIFAQGISGMYGTQMSLSIPDSHKSVFYQFVDDVYPPWKNMLVLTVGILVGIVLLPLQKLRQLEYLQTKRGPSAALWMVSGGATGIVLVIALAFLLVYPSSVPQEYRLFYLVILMMIATLGYRFKGLVAIGGRPSWLPGLGAALVLGFYLFSGLMQVVEGGSKFDVGIAGILFVLLGGALPSMQSALVHESEGESDTALVAWWWFAMAAGSAAALFWSMRLYSAQGDGLLLIAGLLLIFVAGVFRWYGRLPASEILERAVMDDELVLCPQPVPGLPSTPQ